eukprot:COSAG01_NODE_4395_length_5068_cov_5.633930_6_plen_136_part_00
MGGLGDAAQALLSGAALGPTNSSSADAAAAAHGGGSSSSSALGLTITSSPWSLQLLVWAAVLLVWASGATQRLLARSIAQRTYALVSPEVATQSILLGYYAFGAVGVIGGPLTVALTNGLLKVFKDSVVFYLRSG